VVVVYSTDSKGTMIGGTTDWKGFKEAIGPVRGIISQTDRGFTEDLNHDNLCRVLNAPSKCSSRALRCYVLLAVFPYQNLVMFHVFYCIHGT
jgi:hypothetical protein